MFLQLFLKECKYLLHSLTFYLYLACVIFMYVSQVLPEMKIIEEPKVGQEDYGMKYSKDQNDIRKAAVETLIREYTANSYTAYPFGFYKRVILNEMKQNQVQDILQKLTGLRIEEINEKIEAYISQFNQNEEGYSIDEEGNVISPVTEEDALELDLQVVDTISYEYFLELMEDLNNIIGGGSNYTGVFLSNLAMEPRTYEDARNEYHEIIEKDKMTGAYARVFCDYIGIFLAILPVFVAVTMGLRDKKSKCKELVYVSNTSSKVIVLSRYLAMVVMMFLPILIFALEITFEFIMFGRDRGIAIDSFAFVKYSATWLLPNILVATSVGIFCTEIFESAVAIAVQGLWWIISLFHGMQYINGGYSNLLLIRHNELGNYDVYQKYLNTLIVNRVGYTALALALVGVTVIIYEEKRKGKFHAVRTILSNRKSKCKA